MHRRHTRAALRRSTHLDPGRALRHLHRQQAAARRRSVPEQPYAAWSVPARDLVNGAARLGIAYREVSERFLRNAAALARATPSAKDCLR